MLGYMQEPWDLSFIKQTVNMNVKSKTAKKLNKLI